MYLKRGIHISCTRVCDIKYSRREIVTLILRIIWSTQVEHCNISCALCNSKRHITLEYSRFKNLICSIPDEYFYPYQNSKEVLGLIVLRVCASYLQPVLYQSFKHLFCFVSVFCWVQKNKNLQILQI